MKRIHFSQHNVAELKVDAVIDRVPHVNGPDGMERAFMLSANTGTDIARETADVILISADLADLTQTLRIARRARRIVLANFIGTIAVDLVGMALAALGILGPVLAAIVHVGSESAFILNSARLIPGHRSTAPEPSRAAAR